MMCVGFPMRTPCGNEAIHPRVKVTMGVRPLWCEEHEKIRRERIGKQLRELAGSFKTTDRTSDDR